ncbi:MAG: hypothetical protein WDM79_19065 [Terricaulis sp.]
MFGDGGEASVDAFSQKHIIASGCEGVAKNPWDLCIVLDQQDQQPFAHSVAAFF